MLVVVEDVAELDDDGADVELVVVRVAVEVVVVGTAVELVVMEVVAELDEVGVPVELVVVGAVVELVVVEVVEVEAAVAFDGVVGLVAVSTISPSSMSSPSPSTNNMISSSSPTWGAACFPSTEAGDSGPWHANSCDPCHSTNKQPKRKKIADTMMPRRSTSQGCPSGVPSLQEGNGRVPASKGNEALMR